MLRKSVATLPVCVILLLTLLLTACGSQQTQPENSTGNEVTAETSMKTIETQDGQTVFHMPSAYFFDELGEMVDLVQFAADNNLTSAVYDEPTDTVIITMPTEDYQEMLTTIHSQIDETFSVMWQDRDYTTFMEGIESGENYETVNVYVNDTYDRDSALYDVAPQIAIFAQMYQDYLGWNGNGVSVIQFLTTEGEVRDAFSFPDAWAIVNDGAGG